ncbi:LuxR C-terminal-related transcriptional regulator [Streptomyces sp. NPDC090056]|uniref:helix-turn-helix transcriptional regulator n=1 Tax=Streptomyces sp. NPDC090056 TaxID=3365934 RepID=UPI00380793F1
MANQQTGFMVSGGGNEKDRSLDCARLSTQVLSDGGGRSVVHTSPEPGAHNKNNAQEGEVLALLLRVIDALAALERSQERLVRELRYLHPAAEGDDDVVDERVGVGFTDWCRASGLTERESQTLAALLTGATNRKMGRDLGVTERTVKNTLHSVYVKLGVSGRSEAISRTMAHLVRRRGCS